MAAIIKAGQIHEQATAIRHAEFNLEDMTVRANAYLQGIREQAARMLQQAEADAAAVRGQAAAAGQEEARQQARQEAMVELKQQWATLAPALQSAIDQVQQLQHSWTQQWEQTLVRLAVAIAERVIRRKVEQDPSVTETWIREALELAAGSNQIVLHLHPDDYERLGPFREQLARDFGQLAPTRVVADGGISPGGCRVTTERGEIDHQIEMQLERLQDEMTC